MTLSSRFQKILSLLIETRHPLRIKDIAAEFQVSERTVKYDLEPIREWLLAHHAELQSQPRKGIWMEADEAVRNKLAASLKDDFEEHGFLNQHERVRYLALQLLFSDAYFKINDFCEKFNVSRNTVVSDLNEIEASLRPAGLSVERSRHGIRVMGSEAERRIALEYLLQDSLDNKEMTGIVKSLTEKAEYPAQLTQLKEKLLLGDEDLRHIFQAMKTVTRQLEEEIGITLSDRMAIGIFIRFCISAKRLQVGGEITPSKQEIQKSKQLAVYGIFHNAQKRLSEAVNIHASENETVYISKQVVGLIESTRKESYAAAQEPDVFQKTSELIQQVSLKTQIDFGNDMQLFNDLLAHLSDKVAKHRMGIVDPNPLLSNVLRSFPEMFTTIKQSCFETFLGDNVYFTDADLAYIVMHFQAAYERIQEEHPFKVLVVCGTGRGSAQFLKTILEREVHGIQVTGTCSVLALEKQLEHQHPDLLVSVVNIDETSVPIVTVNHVPTKQDILTINQTLAELRKQRSLPRHYQNRMELPFEQSSAENFVQNIIFKGYALSRAVNEEFTDVLTEQRASGLQLHLLLMMNRVAFQSCYSDENGHRLLAEPASELRLRLEKLLASQQLELPESEIHAILRYLM